MTAPLTLPCLCLVVDCSVVNPGDIPGRVAAAVEGGVTLVQLRAKEMPGGQLLSLAREVRRGIGDQVPLIVNERIDVAVAAGADGVQLGEEALSVSSAREMLPTGSIVGRSVHSEKRACRACSDGADFLVVGTMFATASHPGEQPVGPAMIMQMAAWCQVPVLGIGGITTDNVEEVITAGASGVAVIRSVLASEDPRAAAEELAASMREAWRSHRGSGKYLSRGRQIPTRTGGLN